MNEREVYTGWAPDDGKRTPAELARAVEPLTIEEACTRRGRSTRARVRDADSRAPHGRIYGWPP